MIRLAIIVEGETEEEFVKSVLAPHLRTREVEARPHLIGGNLTVERLASEMANLFWSYDRVTSFVDFYGFRNSGHGSREDLETRVHEQVSENIKRSWDQSRVFPCVQQYEFEGLPFLRCNGLWEVAGSSPRLGGEIEGSQIELPDAGRDK